MIFTLVLKMPLNVDVSMQGYSMQVFCIWHCSTKSELFVYQIYFVGFSKNALDTAHFWVFLYKNYRFLSFSANNMISKFREH